MSWLSHNIAVFAVFLLLASLGWVFGGINGPYLPFFVPWLAIFAIETLFACPQRHPFETLDEARQRVLWNLKGDPLVWIVLVTLVLLAIPFANRGLCPQCDAAAIAAGASAAPPVTYLPFCVNRLHHLSVFLWFLAAFSALVVTRHALVRSGKRLLVAMLVWNGSAMAVFGFVQQLAGAPGPWWVQFGSGMTQYFSTFAYPNMAGDYFAALFILAFGAWRSNVLSVEEYEEENQDELAVKNRSSHSRFWRRHHPVIAMALLFIAALSSLSRAAIIFVTASAVLLFLHQACVSLTAMKKIARVKTCAIFLLTVVAIVLAAVVFTPESVRKELDTVDAVDSLDRFTGRSEYHDQASRELWLDHPVFGCGGWGYKHLGMQKMPQRVTRMFRYDGCGVGSANVHNDFMQFLCEHGCVVMLLLVAIFAYLLKPVVQIWRMMAEWTRFDRHTHLPPPKSFFAFPLPALAPLLAALVTLLHALGDCPLRSPAIFALVLVELACVPGYLPPLKR